MKKNLLFVILIAFVSCNEDFQYHKEKPQDASKESDISNSPKGISSARDKPLTKTHIQLENGEYRSICDLVGVTLGATFPHTTIVDPTGITDGEPIPIDFIDSQDNPGCTALIVGGKFSMIIPTSFADLDQSEIDEYFDDLREFWEDETGTVAHPALPTTGNGTSPIEVTGLVVRDHESPTNASIISDETYQYIPPSIPSPNPGPSPNTIFLGILQKNGYSIKFYGKSGFVTSGTVTQVEVRNSANTIVGGVPLTIKYALNYDLDEYHMKGTLKIGTYFMPLDDDMLVAW